MVTPNPSQPLSYEFSPEALILGGGDFPTHPIPLSILHNTPKTICLDGASETYLKKGFKPWRIVGDLDSLSPKTKGQYAEIIRGDSDQETNDQTKGVKYLTKKGIRRIAIVGATGKREDHTLGNISLLTEYQKQGIEARIYTNHGVFMACQNTNTFLCPVGTAISIFNFGTRGMKATGLAYPLRDFTSWWQGTLNSTTKPTFKIECEGTYLVFISYPSEIEQQL